MNSPHQSHRPRGGAPFERRFAIGVYEPLDERQPPVMLGWKTFTDDAADLVYAASIAAEISKALAGEEDLTAAVGVFEFPCPVNCQRPERRRCRRTRPTN